MWAASAMLTVNAPRALMFCTVLCVSVRFTTTVSRYCMVPHAAFMTLSLISGKHKMVILYCLICPMISELLWMQSLVMQNWRPDICPLSDIASGRDKACCYRFLLLLEPFFWYNKYQKGGIFLWWQEIQIKNIYRGGECLNYLVIDLEMCKVPKNYRG